MMLGYCVADKEYALIVIQNPNPGTEHEVAEAS